MTSDLCPGGRRQAVLRAGLAGTAAALLAIAGVGSATAQFAARGGLEADALRAGVSARDGQDLLDFCVANSAECAISVYDVGADRMAHQFPDRPQVLASTSKILFLLGYAQAVASGAIDPDETITKEEWARYLTLDGFALRSSWESLGKPDTVSWGDLARMMIRYSDNSTPDHLHGLLGSKRVKNARKLFKGFHDIPIPIGTMFGLWADGGGIGGEASRIADSYGSIGAVGYRSEGTALYNALGKPGPLATYRKSLCVTPPWDSPGPCAPPQPPATLDERKFLDRNHFTRSTTRTYMKLMEALLARTILKQAERDIIEPILEIWLEAFPTLSPTFNRYGLKGGSLGVPGGGLDILTWAHYMRTSGGGEYVVAVFLQALSDAKNPPTSADVNSFAQTFALSPTFRETVFSTLGADDERAEIVPQILKVKTSGKRQRAAKITVKARAENASPNATKGLKMRLYLSADNVLDADDELLAEASIAKLKAYKGKNAGMKARVTGSATGKYLILAVDDDDDIDEQDEDNNILWERLR